MRAMPLSNEQSRFFRDMGYWRVSNVFSPEQTNQLREFVRQEAKQSTPTTADNPNQKLYGLYDRNPELIHSIITEPKLIAVLESLLGPNIVFVKNRHNHATINNKAGEPAEGMHRDILQPNRGLITAAVYLQDSTVSNGATRVVPGSHKFPYVGAPQQDGGGTWMDEHPEFNGLAEQAVPVPMSEGDVLLFDGTLFHGVGYNPSGEERISLTLGYRSVDELDAEPDESRLICVAGEFIYRGNDR